MRKRGHDSDRGESITMQHELLRVRPEQKEETNRDRKGKTDEKAEKIKKSNKNL